MRDYDRGRYDAFKEAEAKIDEMIESTRCIIPSDPKLAHAQEGFGKACLALAKAELRILSLSAWRSER